MRYSCRRSSSPGCGAGSEGPADPGRPPVLGLAVLGHPREGEADLCPSLRPVGGPDPATHRVEEPRTHEQADPGAARLARRGWRPVVQLEEASGLVVREAGAVVEDPDADLIVLGPDDELDRRLAAAVLHGIGEEVADHLLDVGGIPGDRRGGRLAVGREAGLPPAAL